MGKVFPEIDESLSEFLRSQHMFFVASSPLAADGLVNLSPKGLDTFRILDSKTVAWLDLTGSGIETVAHVRENGRVCLMFCAFEGAPRIVRLHGQGEAFEPGTAEFEQLIPQFPRLAGTRSIIRVSLTRIGDSCGWGVTRYEYAGQRDQLVRFAESLGPEKLRQSQIDHNSKSLDDLPGLICIDDAER